MANELRKILSYSANDIDKLLQNGVYAVESEEERDSLSPSIKTTNRTVYVKNTGEICQWNGSSWDKVSLGGGIETLVGTNENPINFATDMEVGHLYSCSGYVFKNSTTSLLLSRSMLCYKTSESSVVLYDISFLSHINKLDHRKGTTTYLEINSEKGIFTGNATEDTTRSSPRAFNNLSYSGSFTIFAPTSVGTAGQILQSKGLGEPNWVDTSTLGFATTADIEAAIGNVSSLLGNTDDLEV